MAEYYIIKKLVAKQFLLQALLGFCCGCVRAWLHLKTRIV